MPEVLLALRNVRKHFPSVVANDDVSLEVFRGTVHALLGENGAGKSTLLKVICGTYSRDAGEIILQGKVTSFRSPADAIANGVHMVQQQFSLVKNFTVLENLLLTPNLSNGLRLNKKGAEALIKEMATRFNVFVDARRRIDALPMALRQRVEITRALARNAILLLLDEPTSVLTVQESAELFKTLRSMADGGISVLFTTHKLEEALRSADLISVLRSGKLIATLKPEQTNYQEVAKLMIGSYLEGNPPTRNTASHTINLKVENLSCKSDEGRLLLKGVAFEISGGEILGIAGVTGNGQRELLETIAGLRRAHAGTITLLEGEITNLAPRRIAELGVGYIPEDGAESALNPQFSLVENLTMRRYREYPFSRGLFMDRHAMMKFADRVIDDYDIRPKNVLLQARFFSGGNQQKIILAREIDNARRLLIASNPTRGLDVKTALLIHGRIVQIRNRGLSVILASEDLNEILELSDRVMVMFKGEMVGILERSSATPERLGLMMGGKLDMDSRRVPHA